MAISPPEAMADSGDEASYRFRLPKTRVPEPIANGIRGWRTTDDYLVLRIHYSADPERADAEWIAEVSKGYIGGTDGAMWQREMEIDFGSYAGLPVYPTFDKDFSVKEVKYNPSLPLWRGWDFGYRNPAVTFHQLWPDNTLVYLHEIFPTIDKEKLPGISTDNLCKVVLAETERRFPGAGDSSNSAGVYDFCDPSGTQKKETSDFSSVELLQQNGMDVDYSVVGRKNRIEYLRIYVEGKHENGSPRFLISPHCTLGIEAFAAAYRFPEEGSGAADREMPDLSRKVQEQPYIHIMDSCEYVAACNLEVTYPTHTGGKKPAESNELITDLASAYLGAVSQADNRVASMPLANAAGPDDLETGIQELLGIDTLEDAWSLT